MNKRSKEIVASKFLMTHGDVVSNSLIRSIAIYSDLTKNREIHPMTYHIGELACYVYAFVDLVGIDEATRTLSSYLV